MLPTAPKEIPDSELISRIFNESDMWQKAYSYFSPQFRNKISFDRFFIETRRIKSSFGGAPKHREVAIVEAKRFLPDSGTRGNFTQIRFVAFYPRGKILEDIYLHKSRSGELEVVGIWFNPAY